MSTGKNKYLLPIIESILYVYAEEINYFLPSMDDKHKFIVLKSGCSWKSIYFTPGSQEFTETEKIDDAGSIFEQALKFIFPGDDHGNALLFETLSNRPIVVLIKFCNSTIIILGDTDNPARLTTDLQLTGKLNGQKIQISRQGSCRVPWWGDIQTIPVPEDEIPGTPLG